MTEKPLLEDRIGEVVRVVTFPVEAGKIAEFARAMRDPDPIFRSASGALAAGFDAVTAPLTFSVASAHYSGGNATDLPLNLGLDLSRTVHGEQLWTYKRPVVAGETLVGVTTIAAVDRRSGRNGEMLRITTTTEYRDEGGDVVMTEEMLTIELPPQA